MLQMFLKSLLLIIPVALIGFIILGTIPPSRSDIIGTDYASLRNNFLKAAASQGAEVTNFPIAAKGRFGEDLFIDLAWIGDKDPDQILLHISGTHGVEGYAGSAIQTKILNTKFTVGEKRAVVFVHALNPWGMAHYRRFNENNVDLNRNFLTDAAAFKGSPEGYRLIEGFLNPTGMPSRLDTFFPEAAWSVIRHGFNTLKQAIAGGQYDFPKGIYYGGSTMQESNQILSRILTERMSRTKRMYAIEIHTGLGDWAKDVLFWPLPLSNPKSKTFSALLGEQLSTDAPEEGVGFRTPGDLQNEAPKLLPQTEMYWLLQEFGAYGPVKTLRALRDENRFYQSGGNNAEHWSKKMLLEAFTPGDKQWQETVVSRGVELFNKGLGALNSPS